MRLPITKSPGHLGSCFIDSAAYDWRIFHDINSLVPEVHSGPAEWNPHWFQNQRIINTNPDLPWDRLQPLYSSRGTRKRIYRNEDLRRNPTHCARCSFSPPSTFFLSFSLLSSYVEGCLEVVTLFLGKPLHGMIILLQFILKSEERDCSSLSWLP